MMFPLRPAAALLCLAAATLASAGTVDLPPLHHDPFARPELLAAPGGGASSSAAPALRLTAVVLAGPRTLAMVNGLVVELGGEVEGFRLIQVGEDKALFKRAGHRVWVMLERSAAR